MSDESGREQARLSTTNRRWFLRSGIAATLVGLAGCSDNGGEQGTSDGDTPGETETGTPADGTESEPQTPEETDDPEQGLVGGDDEWPLFQHDINRTGYASSNTAPAGEVSEQWRYVLGESGGIECQPILADGTIYTSHTVTGTGTAIDASPDLRMVAVDAMTGEETWTKTVTPAHTDSITSSETEAAPAYANGTVYFYTGGGHLFAVDAASGDIEWDRHFTSVFTSAQGSPLPRSGTLYVPLGEPKTNSGDGPNGVRALDAATGDTRWTYTDAGGYFADDDPDDDTTGDGDSKWFHSLTWADGTLIAVGDNDTYGLDPDSGTELWEHPSEQEDNVWGRSNVAFADGACYTHRIPVHSFTPDGTERWTSADLAVTSDGQDGPAVANGRVFVSDDFDSMYAVNTANGDVEWTTTVEGLSDSYDKFNGSVAVAGDGETVYATSNRELLAFDAATGELQWQYELPDANVSDPIVANGGIYLTCRNDNETSESQSLLLALA